MLSSALRDFLLHGGGGGEVDDFDGLPDAGTAAENHEEGVNSKIKVRRPQIAKRLELMKYTMRIVPGIWISQEVETPITSGIFVSPAPRRLPIVMKRVASKTLNRIAQ